MKTLIAGAGGQLGTALTTILGDRCLPLDRAALDITNRAQIGAAITAHRPDLVINAAAYNFVDKAESEPAAAFAVNETGPRLLAEATAAAGIPFVHVSTDYVFDGRLGRPYKEEDATNPLSQYGKSKLAGEVAARGANPKTYIVRTAWVYHDTGRNFFRLMLGLSEKGKVRVVSDQRSSPTYAPHLAEAILKMAASGAYGTYHLAGSGTGASRFEQLAEFYRLIGQASEVEPVSMSAFPQPAPRPQYTVLETGRTPRFVLPHWRDGVAEFARVFIRNGRK